MKVIGCSRILQSNTVMLSFVCNDGTRSTIALHNTPLAELVMHEAGCKILAESFAEIEIHAGLRVTVSVLVESKHHDVCMSLMYGPDVIGAPYYAFSSTGMDLIDTYAFTGDNYCYLPVRRADSWVKVHEHY